MMPDFVLLKIRGIKILPFISLPFGYLDCEPKVVIYRITLLVSELLVDLCKCECNRMNGSSLLISQLLLFSLLDPTSMLSIQPDILTCGIIVVTVCCIDQHFYI